MTYSELNLNFSVVFLRIVTTTLEGFSSTTSGIDIEFIDCVDGRKKYLVEFTFNDETGNIWEIWIHDAL